MKTDTIVGVGLVVACAFAAAGFGLLFAHALLGMPGEDGFLAWHTLGVPKGLLFLLIGALILMFAVLELYDADKIPSGA